MNTRKDKLALLQIEDYDTTRYLAKASKPIDQELGKRIKWTMRLKLTSWLSYVLGITLANYLLELAVSQYERGRWLRARAKIRKLKKAGLRVVVIVGSYGKTSVKDAAYDLLRQKYVVVKTPGNINTLLGIDKVIEWELDEKAQVFLAEVGAYHRGDILKLCRMLEPEVGVLTGITSQHLERFGSMAQIVSAKTEIVRYTNAHQGVLIANGSDELVKRHVEQASWYKGEGRAVNLAGAKLIASTLGMTSKEIGRAVKQIRPVRSRFEMTFDRYGMKVIDNSYSSNEKSFEEDVRYLGEQKHFTRVLVTPGLVELGSETKRIHQSLGRLLPGRIDLLVLVGKNERTKNLVSGAGSEINYIYIEKILDFVEALKREKLKKEPLVLIENDVTENY